ncbi:MAG: TlpA family protein disulfide reductase, partial [Tannerellaceae bacterium]
IRDTVALKDKKINFNLPDSVGLMVSILELPKTLPDGNMRAMRMEAINFFRFPNEKVNVKADFTEAGLDYDITGTPLYDDLKKTEKDHKPIEDQIKAAQSKFRQMQMEGTPDSILREEYNKMMPLFDSLNAYKMQYIRNNPGSIVSGFYFNTLPADSAIAFYEIITPEVKNGPFKGVIDNHMASANKQIAINKAKENIAVGKQAPDFTLTDINGKPFTLSSLYGKGKYIVLDFWGVWCGWCIKGFPEMKSYYEKYNKKVEFVGIDCNDTEEKWKQGVEENKLPWINVQNTKENDITTTYAIQGFPTKMIISPKGEIEAVILGESPEFYKKLDELLK